jgi:S-adenosylmethionine:tRNA ribosyltransferase-isomerase
VRAAVWPRQSGRVTRLLHLDPMRGTFMDRRFDELPRLFRPGDLVVVNDAATLPASLPALTARGAVEVRLAGLGAGATEWSAVLFGAGSWRHRTEDRPAPPVLAAGDAVTFAGGLSAAVVHVSSVSPRLVALRFDRDREALWAALYRAGRPVQYSYVCGPLSLDQVQTPFAGRPWAVEMPSAGRPLGAGLLREARLRGVRVATVTLAAGLSSTGDPRLDARLPLPERYEIPAETVEAICRACGFGRRVIAVGTTVVRALEGCAAERGTLRAGTGWTDFRAGEGFRPTLVTGLLSGLHEPGSSHFELLGGFAPDVLLTAALQHAESSGYLGHEFGDSLLVLADRGGSPA